MNTRVILHIGMHKTGTSAIQAFLANNERILWDREGIRYLLAGRIEEGKVYEDHRLLGWTGVERYANRYNRAVTSRLWEEVRNEILSTQPKGAVISSEFLWPAGSHEIAEFARSLSGLDVRVVIYVRNYLGFALSAYQQVVKSGKYSGSFDRYLEENLWLFDYAKILRSWGAVFGVQNVHLRIYDKVRKFLLDDFMEVAGFIAPLRREFQQKRNVSPSDPAVLLLRHMNLFEEKWLKKRPMLMHKIRRQIIMGRGAAPFVCNIARLVYGDSIVRDGSRKYLQKHISAMREDFLRDFVSPEDWAYFEF